jgi:hypothetical protein
VFSATFGVFKGFILVHRCGCDFIRTGSVFIKTGPVVSTTTRHPTELIGLDAHVLSSHIPISMSN